MTVTHLQFPDLLFQLLLLLQRSNSLFLSSGQLFLQAVQAVQLSLAAKMPHFHRNKMQYCEKNHKHLPNNNVTVQTVTKEVWKRTSFMSCAALVASSACAAMRATSDLSKSRSRIS
ncbi:hypothetical protein E2C01_017159 [Portunus trituberculatus]|uniref:Uncharacterized protein n=1 Tax=Portunus trituberculatus TaxID=210409 RepID=A0A5B7DSP6_PORTR|nr:hypothetical protein [Portunus trituberculatus]